MEAREKAGMKKAAWEAQYERLVRQNRSRQTSEDRRAERDALKEEAAERTAAAEKSIADLEHLLVSFVEASPVFEIEKQKIASSFSERQPQPHNTSIIHANQNRKIGRLCLSSAFLISCSHFDAIPRCVWAKRKLRMSL
jgi:hypothetical protein